MPGALHFLAKLRRVVFLPQHLHIAAQRQDADAVEGFAPAETAHFQAANVETDEEFVDFDAAHLGHGKVAQLVDEDNKPQAQGDLKRGEP